MLEFSIEAFILQKLLSSLKSLCTELKLYTDDEGITMQRMDDCHAAIASFHLTNDCFRSYYSESPTEFGIRVDHFEKLLEIFSPETIIKITKNDNDSSQIDHYLLVEAQLSHEDNNQLSETLKAKIGIIDLPSVHLTLQEDKDGASQVTVNSKEFAKELSVCKQLGLTTVTLSITINSFTIESSGETKYRKTFNKEDSEIIIKCSKNITQEFATHYLIKFMKASSMCKTAVIVISETKCSNFQFSICDIKGDPTHGKLLFQLAPRVT